MHTATRVTFYNVNEAPTPHPAFHCFLTLGIKREFLSYFSVSIPTPAVARLCAEWSVGHKTNVTCSERPSLSLWSRGGCLELYYIIILFGAFGLRFLSFTHLFTCLLCLYCMRTVLAALFTTVAGYKTKAKQSNKRCVLVKDAWMHALEIKGLKSSYKWEVFITERKISVLFRL